MAHPDLIRQILARQPERGQQELDAGTEHAETLGSDRVCTLSGHAFVLLAGRFVCAACGAGVTEGL